MSAVRDVVIVGANVAGIQAVESLRARGYDGRLTVIDSDADAPYNRPPLSKELLAGELDEDDIALLSASELAQLDVDLLAGTCVDSVDPHHARVQAGALSLHYDQLLIASGSTPLIPKGWDALLGVHPLRTLEDARRIGRELHTGRPNLVVVGGGLIGCEVASTARKLGLDVTLVEAGATLLNRLLPRRLVDPLALAHHENGVRIVCNAQVRCLVGHDRVAAVELNDGRLIPADLVVLGLGARPNVEWLQSSGLPIRDGVLTDGSLRVTDTIFAAGDVARVVNAHGSEAGHRAEHWTNARQHGGLVATSMLGNCVVGDAALPPYVWSDQYDIRLQIVGDVWGEHTHAMRMDRETGHHLTLIGRNGVVTGAVCLGPVAGFVKARSLVNSSAKWADATTWKLE